MNKPFSNVPSLFSFDALRAAALVVALPFIAINSFSIQNSLVGMDFADLMKIKVTSVQRREEPVATTPAAVYVITAEDIRRSGATTIPDLLRGVPGLSVARINGNTWAISARGGQNSLANKLLVLIDGRSVYSPLFAGVFWDVQDIPLETIDRIEIIRGPGGSVWGANAVNGVINIIRKSAETSQGSWASVGGGSEERFNGNVETGWKIGERTFASAYGRYREFDDLETPSGQGAGDQGRQGGGGLQVDGRAGDTARWHLSSDAYNGQFYENRTTPALSPPSNQPIHGITEVNGANVLGRWAQNVGEGTVSVQTYFDHTYRRIPQVFQEIRDTWDVAAQHQFSFLRIHRFTYGGGFRLTQDAVGNTLGVRFEPDHATDHITNVFAQDEVHFTPSWSTNVGAKYERNDYTGWEFQPSVRTGWEFVKNHYLWASVSQAVRTPTRLDDDVKLQSVLSPVGPTLLSAQGSDNFVSERLTAYEVGYRGQPLSALVASVSAFFNKYDHLRGAAFQPSYLENDPAPPHVIVPLVINNDLWGETFGAETAQRVRLFPWWQVTGSYSYLHQRLHARGEDPVSVAASEEIADPVHQVAVRSSWNVGPKVELDSGVRWVDAIQNHAIGAYTAVDARAAYKASPSLTFEVDGQNLLEPTHREFAGGDEIERAVFGKAIWRMR